MFVVCSNFFVGSFFFLFKQKTAYEMRISDWSSDVCSSDLAALLVPDAGVLIAGDMLSDVEVPLPDLAAEDPLGDYERALDLFAGQIGRASCRERVWQYV